MTYCTMKDGKAADTKGLPQFCTVSTFLLLISLSGEEMILRSIVLNASHVCCLSEEQHLSNILIA